MKKLEPISGSEEASPELLRTYGAVSTVFGVILAALGFSIYGETTFVHYLSFLAWFGSLLLILKGWICLSINNEKAFWSFHSAFSKYSEQ